MNKYFKVIIIFFISFLIFSIFLFLTFPIFENLQDAYRLKNKNNLNDYYYNLAKKCKTNKIGFFYRISDHCCLNSVESMFEQKGILFRDKCEDEYFQNSLKCGESGYEWCQKVKR